MKPHPVCRAIYTLYMRHHSHYLCPHNHCIDNITFNLFMTSHLPYVWHPLHYKMHHILILWPLTTIFMSLHPLYLTSCPPYLSHHIQCIDDITNNCISEVTSALIHNIISIVYDMRTTVWHHNHCIHDMRFPKYDITSRIYDITSPIPVISQTLCLWKHANSI